MIGRNLSRDERAVLLVVGVATLSAVAFVALLWGMRRLAEPPRPGDADWPAWQRAAAERVGRDDGAAPPLDVDEAARRLASHQYDLGRDVVVVRGEIRALVAEDGRLRVTLGDATRARLDVWFEGATPASLGLETGAALTVRGLALDVDGRRGLHFAVVAR